MTPEEIDMSANGVTDYSEAVTDVDVIRQALEALCLDSLEVPVAKVLTIPVAERGHVDVLIIAISEGLDSLAARVHSLEAENEQLNAKVISIATDFLNEQARVHSLERTLRRIADFPRPWGGALSAADEMRALARAVVLEGAAGNAQAGGFIHQPTTRIMGVENVDIGKPLGGDDERRP